MLIVACALIRMNTVFYLPDFIMSSRTCEHAYLYYLTENDKTDVKTNGISATNPGGHLSPEAHIHWAGKRPSQYITTSLSFSAFKNLLKEPKLGVDSASGFSQYNQDHPTWRYKIQPHERISSKSSEDNNVQENAKLVTINCQGLTGVEFIDLTDSETRSKWLRTDKANHFAEKFKIVLVKGHIPSDCIDSIYTAPPYIFLYRLLREDEWHYETICEIHGAIRATLNGPIKAKNPDSDVSVLKHVDVGSYSPRHSRYISTSASQQAIEMFARKSKTKVKMVVKISCHLLKDVDYIDLTEKAIRDKHIPQDEERANNFAKKFHEVLLVGEIPERCVHSFQEIKTETQDTVSDKPIIIEDLSKLGPVRSFQVIHEKSPKKNLSCLLDMSKSLKHHSKDTSKTTEIEEYGSKSSTTTSMNQSIGHSDNSRSASSLNSSGNQSNTCSSEVSGSSFSLNDSDTRSWETNSSENETGEAKSSDSKARETSSFLNKAKADINFSGEPRETISSQNKKRETNSSSSDNSSSSRQLSSNHWDFYPGGI